MDGSPAGGRSRTRRPAVAGRFYPGDPDPLAAIVDRLLDAVPHPGAEPLAAAYVVPHAGYVYSGPTAAFAYARLRRHAADIRRVVLLGPAHFVPLDGCAAPASTAWATPLGELPIEDPTPLVDAGHLVVDESPHQAEHALEVQLPWLQRALHRPVPVLPVAVGRTAPDRVAALLAAAEAPGTVVVCSTDLSHYLDQGAARARDAATAAAITALTPEAIGVQDACGVFALRGLLAWARDRRLRPELLELSTSADTAGPPDRVVGYAAVALHRGTTSGA